MAEKLSASEKVAILRKIGRLRAEKLIIVLKYLRSLLKAKLDEIIKIKLERARVEAEINELRRKYDEGK